MINNKINNKTSNKTNYRNIIIVKNVLIANLKFVDNV